MFEGSHANRFDKYNSDVSLMILNNKTVFETVLEYKCTDTD